MSVNSENIKSKIQERYEGVEGLRGVAILGIVAMHLKENIDFSISGYFYNTVITYFTNFVFLFMIVSAFSMCCGYYDKIREGRIGIDEFYKRRYTKILPYFSVMVFIEIVVDFSVDNLYEAFADLTLCFGLLPNPRITVVGVGWTLGVIFVFYLLFPFFCHLLRDLRNAIFVLILAIIYNYICIHYFFDTDHVLAGYSYRTNILFCAMFFVAGGILYLKRSWLKNLSGLGKFGMLFLTTTSTVIYFGMPLLPSGFRSREDLFYFLLLITFSLWLCCAINDRCILFNNRILKFIGGISMEIYLCHMPVLRAVEKIGITKFRINPMLDYVLVFLCILAGSIIFSVCLKYIIGKMSTLFCGRGEV